MEDAANRVPVVSFSSNDVDEAVGVTTQLFFPNEVEPIGRRAPFGLQLVAGTLGALSAGVLEYGCPIESVGQFGATYNVAFLLGGSIEFATGGSAHVANESLAVVSRPDTEARVRGWMSGGERMALLTFDAHVLETELRAMLGRDARGTIDMYAELDLRGQAGREWRQLAGAVIEALDTGDVTAFHPLLAVPLSSAITRGLLLATNHPYRSALDEVHERIRPSLVRRALAIVDERAHEPLTVSALAAAVGCSVSALRYGFQSHVGMSPARYVALVRMDRVHHELLRSSPEDTSVMDVLDRWGVRHAGPFVQAYRKEYGVLPAVTLHHR